SFVTGSISKLRAYGGINLGTFPLGSTVRGLAYDGSVIWACNSQDNTFSRLNAADGLRLGTYRVGARPRALAFDGTRMWIANSGDNTVSVITGSPQPIQTVQYAPAGWASYQTIQPVPLPPIATAVDAAFRDFSVKSPATSAAVGAIVGTLLSDN
ncbi:MAG: hypothetical protein JO299_00575, partial [Gammaproteobacteria bacterium]|nr:hypothetical protein [Gammaproteobacteria bacterium]